MFAKPFRVKSNTVIKGSDRRKLKTDISNAFPALSAEDLSELVPNKEDLNVVKIYAHKGDAVTLYVLHKNPIFFQVEKQLYPTVYTLWHYPDLLPSFTTWPAVLQKLAGGADLMLPGVVVPPGGLPEVKQGDCCAVTVVRNRAPVAVGTAAMSTSEMQSQGMKGRGVSILHTYMDTLWGFGDKTGPPSIPPTDGMEDTEGDVEGEGEAEGEGGGETEEGKGEPCPEPEEEQNAETLCPNLRELSLAPGEGGEGQEEGASEEKHRDDEQEPEDSRSPQEQMDALLFQCLLHALKSKVKKSELPLLTSTFLRNHMFSCCPSGKQLDIKKSSYKKLSKFLQCMQRQHQLLQVKELSKGVESIVEVDWKHPELRSFCPPEGAAMEESPMESNGDSDRPYQPPEITTLYSVSARLEPLFQDSQKRKGAVLSPAEVRTIVTEYVKKNELVDETNKNYVTINPTLCDCLLEKSEYQEVEKLKWDELFSRTLDKMQHCHQLLFPGQEPIIRKGHMEPIDISMASRGSNKKVTLIKNLELYGLDPAGVASVLQHQVQASTVLNPVPGAKDRVLVQIQGNQVQQVGKLLLDQYQIPRKYIQGLEKAQKPGKKK
ncbi:eukaryotic translation initiation factor 2D [Megalops cyprinoides]|uniref:eukaryotic translation initiation factor 2D n=1 Tax=Megalops cyprinoides TaxID=118141 RepID=UPI0018650100|nr:eukaryotic translation initiation factor 2D [Megalops cyprinoides]